MTEERYVTEVPSSLKQLARLVVRGFYTIEDALIVDMLVRNPCMKEDDICELLKFERKMLRARIATLKNDKFIQVRLKMETGPDGKAQKVNYYFINYKTFVNVVKYKLDLMRKRMETEERDATSRASFKCPSCSKTFTDLEADQLYDMMTQEFRCTFCNQVVEEDQSALPKKDSRLLLAKFNEQLETLYILLREVEGIKLAPEILEPEPVDINTIRGLTNKQQNRPAGEQWSGEATRNQGLAVEETRVDITIGDTDNAVDATTLRKERPVWMVESTIAANDQSDSVHSTDMALEKAASTASNAKSTGKEKTDDIMSVLLAHEKQNPANTTAHSLKGTEQDSGSDSSDNESKDPYKLKDELAAVAEMESEDSESDDNVPTVLVNGKPVALTSIDDDVIATMTPSEKETYIQVYQEYYSHMYD
ncbi:general transcription factor IIE subunit 1 [Zerene cesonia]|uniref:general transcription factor IIE subunit 1 n=1 Tax=Zerene cesonia TaxID=33412 RepID=UPI0018E54D80|nr:general transcription factor IIE subunit 1 [Zerene cesonia]